MTDFSCHFNQKDTLRIPNEYLCVILTSYFLLCKVSEVGVGTIFQDGSALDSSLVCMLIWILQSKN